ncbi:hypothetical protein LEP1GSC085_2342 [Leptospira interrogans str. L0996]|nr:hypothetical protein LEP1GSC085_2342 [Leptospira interrogans str. L0996]
MYWRTTSPLKLPNIVEGSVIASETASPVQSYDVMNLFDSRYEYAWASDKKVKELLLILNLKKLKSSIKSKFGTGIKDRINTVIRTVD